MEESIARGQDLIKLDKDRVIPDTCPAFFCDFLWYRFMKIPNETCLQFSTLGIYFKYKLH